MVDMFADVFRDNAEDRAPLRGARAEEGSRGAPRDRRHSPEALYRKWRTWQMSDHSPLWIEIETDYANRYLETIGT